MPHSRSRQIEKIFIKRLKSNPVVILNGARQVGKSFLARDLLKNHVKQIVYLTLDNAVNLEMAKANPSTFLAQVPKESLFVIDEAQKAPGLFDSIKEIVDNDRRPTQFLLLGSTEFSHRTKVRESLTGRASYLRLFPFNFAETKHLEISHSLLTAVARVTRADTLKYLERGGMPGIFSVRDFDVRIGLFEDWLNVTLERDLKSVSGRAEVDSNIARRILESIAKEEDTSDSEIAKKLRISVKTVQKYLVLLKALFVVCELPTCIESTGRPQNFLCDVGIAHILNAPFVKRLRTWIHLEILSNIHSKGERFSTKLETYRGPKGGRIDFVLQTKDNKKIAILVLQDEKFLQQDLEILKSFAARFSNVTPIALAPVNEKIKYGNIDIYPWESIV